MAVNFKPVRGRRRRVRWGIAVALAALVCSLTPAAASGSSSGEVTRAEVDAEWTSASIAGVAVRTNDCVQGSTGPKPGPGEEPPPPPKLPNSPPWECGWIPYATVGHGSSLEDCSSPSRRWNSIGAGVQVVWVGPELKASGSAEFDLAEVDLEHGSAAPLLCLSAVEAVREGVACAPEVSCPPYAVVHTVYSLGAAKLEVTQPVRRDALGPTEPGPQRCSRAKHKHRHHGKNRIGLGSAKKVTHRGKRVRRCKTG